MSDLYEPDHLDAVAHFRAGVIGHLLHLELPRGELTRELKRLSSQRLRPPGSALTRTYSVPTLQRWLYRYRKDGLEALRPRPRADRGHGRRLDSKLKALLLDIRREYPSLSAAHVLDRLNAEGVVTPNQLSVATLRRLYRQEKLPRRRRDHSDVVKLRRRWQTATPNDLWHGDVCHGPPLVSGGRRRAVRIHALLDDCSRYVVALEARATEREQDMLEVFADAMRGHGVPARIFLDNGATYRGKALASVCRKLKVDLVHARPYDPQARGKQERLFRTLREQLLDTIEEVHSLHDLQVRLHAWLDKHYHVTPHSGLAGRTPVRVFHDGRPPLAPLGEERLRQAFTTVRRRKLRQDNTLDIAGVTYELDQGFLAGKRVEVVQCAIDDSPPRVRHDGVDYPLMPVDPVANAARPRRRKDFSDKPARPTGFDPANSCLNEAMAQPSSTRSITGEEASA